jgi:KaiC/GvpD/RAD55 family RecA-like ATPase
MGAVEEQPKEAPEVKEELPPKEEEPPNEDESSEEKKPSEEKAPKGAEKDEELAKWLAGEGDSGDLQSWMGDGKPGTKPKGGKSGSEKSALRGSDKSTEALRKWLSGEEDTLEDWLGSTPGKPKVDGAIDKKLVEKDKLLEEREQALKQKEEELEGLKIEAEEVKKAMNKAIKKIEVGDFDPVGVLQETAKLNKELQAEIRKRKRLEEEIQQVKKGSIAVIKYVKAQQMQEKGGAARSLKKKLDSEVTKREKLEIELEKSEELLKSLKEEVDKGIDKLPDDAKDVKKLEMELMEEKKKLEAKEKELKAQEEKVQQQLKNGGGAGEADIELKQKIVAELSSKEREFIEKEADLKKKIFELEEKLNESEIDRKLQKDTSDLKGRSEGEIDTELENKMRELQVKEKSLLVREDEIKRLKEQLKSNEEEITKLKEPLAYKEGEMLRREEDLVYREQMLIEERRKLEEAMRESGSMEVHEMRKKLEELQMQINRKEEEVRAKEQYLNAKNEELRLREKGLIEEEIEARDEDRKLELKIEKAKTGDRRLDDLLLGGVPFGANVLIYGPPFTGKEVTINSFVAEGLQKGVPCIFVITDKLPSEIREEMMFIVSGFEEYEKMGLVRFIDAYSRSIGIEDVEPNVVYIDDATDHKAIMKATDDVSKELMKTHKYYRLAFRSVSTLIAYMDSGSAYKFLQPYAGKRKREKAVAMYAIEKGMHDEQDIQMIGSVMDGMVDYKVEQLKTFLCIKGIGDVQSRAWIDYSYSKQGLSIGSFSLDHIR